MTLCQKVCMKTGQCGNEMLITHLISTWQVCAKQQSAEITVVSEAVISWGAEMTVLSEAVISWVLR